MYFTQEDYEKIKNWLTAHSIKDTEFPKVEDILFNEELVVVQNGLNKRLAIKNIIDFILNQADSELNINSTNPIQNQAVAKAIHELQNRKLVEVVDKLPDINIAKDSVIYILLEEVGRDNNLFTEWIKVDNAWEKVGEFKADVDLTPYLKIEDAPFEKGDEEFSAILKGANAEASNEMATAFGGVESFLYHEGEEDERTIEVPNPTTASGLSAHAEGIGAIASGVGAHAEGNVAITNDYLNEDTGEYEQTIIVTEASGRGAHAEGLGTKSTKSGSHSEGIGTEVNANSGHGEGYYTKVHSGEGTHTEGMQTDGIGNGAHAEGYNTFAKGTAAHAEGRGGIATDYGAHVEGGYLKEGDVKLTLERLDDPDIFRYKITSPSSPNIIAGLGCNLRDGSHVIIERYEGVNELYLSKKVEDGTYIFSNVASGTSSHSEGALNVASGKAAHAEGLKNVASGPSSHVEGESNVSGGDCSHVEGYLNETDKTGVHLEGKNNSSDANYSHVEGINNTTSGNYSHVEGVGLSAIVTLKSAATENKMYEIQEDKPEWLVANDRAWIEGFGELTITSVYDSKWIQLSKKLGIGNKATITAVIYPVQGDRLTRANAIGSHVEGIGTKTNNIGESAVGVFNASSRDYGHTDPRYVTQFSVGIGTSDTNRKNGFEVKANGDTYLCIGGTLYFVTPLTDEELNELFNE